MNYSKSIKSVLLILSFPIVILGQMGGFHSNQEANCKYCHVIEENTNTLKLAWQKSPTNNFYTAYTSSTLDAQISQPLGSSKLCLSCHDGTLASDNSNTHKLNSTQNFGNDLRKSHPISFKYDSYLALKDAGLFDPTSSPSGLGGSIHDDLLIDGNLECISCHDIHGINGIKSHLVKSNNKSRLCLTCHNK